MTGIENKVAVISGGSKGLGINIAKTLLREGYSVATFSRASSPELEQLLQQYPDALYWEPVNICDNTMLAKYLQNVKQKFGRVGYLVNSAGVAPEGLLTLMKSQELAQMIQVNLAGSLSLAQLCAKQMMVAGFGVILNISSIVGIRGFKGVAGYSATKAALDGLTRSLAKELGAAGIRINSVAPGFMETDMTAQLSDKQKARIIRLTPLARLGTVDDVSSLVKFLLSDDAKFITGQTIVVDGGLTV